MSDANPSSDRCRELERMSLRELHQVFLRGQHPDPDTLVGWEFRGTNHPDLYKLVRIKKFIKGFFRRDGAVFGYNSPVVQNGLGQPWIARPRDDQGKRFRFYQVTEVDPTSRDNAYLHAVLLDYGRGGNPWWEPSSLLRDYLVRVDPGNDDLFLGKALIALGPTRVPANFFLLERHRRNGD
jgi:hypothetical protein